MTEAPATRLWGKRIAFAMLVCLILFFHLLPLDTTPGTWVGPDLLLALAFAWAVRRPEYIPVIGLAGLFLLADLLLQRPPGLWAFFALLACENLKSRARALRDGSFAVEWAAVCVAIAGVGLAYRLGLMITLLDPPSFGLWFFELIATMLFYPLVAAFTHGILGVRRAGPGDAEPTGGRL